MNPDSVSMFFYTYVLRSTKDGAWYIGFTHDLRKRLKEHNSGKNVSTKGRGPFEVIYYEAYRNSEDARSREKQLKSWNLSKKCALIERSNPGWHELSLA